MDYKLYFIEAKYHLAVAERMLESYGEYPEKRFLVGVINEAARAVSRLIRAFLMHEGVHGGLDKFLEIAPRYLDSVTCENLVKMLEVERAQKISPVQFTKGDKIILLISGKYRILTVSRIREFVKSIGVGIEGFPTDIKR